MPSWYYFGRSTHLAFHDLTTVIPPPKNLRSLLGLGLKFCPTPRFSTTSVSTSLDRLRRDLFCKTYFASKPLNKSDYDAKLHTPSNWIPQTWMIPHAIHRRFRNFASSLQSKFHKRHCPSNLLWYQRHALASLQSNPDHMIVHCDKNLGPAIIERNIYIKRALDDHLVDETTYRQLTENQATHRMERVKKSILHWLEKHEKDLPASERKFVKYHLINNRSPFPAFYLLFKVHKTPWSTRPIVSCSGSLLHSLGIWVDRKLQSIVQQLPSYLKNTKDLKDELLQLDLPQGAQLFTVDAVSMYTNIETHTALRSIGQYLHQHSATFTHIPISALMEALELIMKNNIFSFGDTFWHQLSGTAMGTPPAPCYATLVYAIHEHIILPKYNRNLLFYKRYIDDIFGIWIPDKDSDIPDITLWHNFCRDLTFHRLRWTVSSRLASVDFMDLTISIKNCRIHTTLYEKALNLYLYIPPHSAHPPGVLTGIVLGNVYRIQTLCSDHTDIQALLRTFYQRLRARGYKPTTLRPLFQRAISKHALQQDNSTHLISSNELQTTSSASVFFHLQFNPGDPKSHHIQTCWKRYVLHPPYESHLSQLRNKSGAPIDVSRLIVAYSRQKKPWKPPFLS